MCGWSAIVFLGVNLAGTRHGSVTAFGYVSESQIYHGAYWGLVSLAFVHQEILHIAFNLYWFWFLGSVFERRLGAPALFGFVVASAFVSSGLQLGTEGIGIGLSGVVYALFGFGWMARDRFPEFARIINERVVQLFLIWFLICVVTTYTGILKIANVAHFTGLILGMMVGGIAANRKRTVPMVAGLVAVVGLSIVPVLWNPLSVEWVGTKAEDALQREDYSAAVPYLRRLERMRGANPVFVWYNLALAFASQGDSVDYKSAVDELKANDPDAAQQIIALYGDPERSKGKDSRH